MGKAYCPDCGADILSFEPHSRFCKTEQQPAPAESTTVAPDYVCIECGKIHACCGKLEPVFPDGIEIERHDEAQIASSSTDPIPANPKSDQSPIGEIGEAARAPGRDMLVR